MLRIIDQGILSRVPGRGAYHPWITPLSDGTFIASQSVGPDLASTDKLIEVLRSDDGRTWISQGSIHEGGGPPTDGYGYGGPQISEVPDGRLLMTAGRAPLRDDPMFDPETEALNAPENLLLWSHDRGRTWSDPQVVPVDLPPEKYTCNGAGSLKQLAGDRWMYPLETWKPEGYDGPPDQKAVAVFSPDQGRTWGELTVVADDPAGRLLWWDQMCAVLPDGRIYTTFWTHRYGTSEDLNDHWSVSADQGRTWTAASARPTCAARSARRSPCPTGAWRRSTTTATSRRASTSRSRATCRTTTWSTRSWCSTPGRRPPSASPSTRTSWPST